MSRKSRKERKREKQEAYRLSAFVRTQRRRVGHMRSFLHMMDRLLRILLSYDRRRS